MIKHFKKGDIMIGLDNADDFGGHSLRYYFITKLANHLVVSTKQVICEDRHSSVSSGLTYISRNQNS